MISLRIRFVRLHYAKIGQVNLIALLDIDSTPDFLVAGTLDRMKIPASIQTVSAVVTDVYVAIALTIILRKKRTGFRACVPFP